jgi:hypothetical protein
VDSWLERYRGLWEGSFDKMESYLHELTKGNPDDPKN